MVIILHRRHCEIDIIIQISSTVFTFSRNCFSETVQWLFILTMHHVLSLYASFTPGIFIHHLKIQMATPIAYVLSCINNFIRPMLYSCLMYCDFL